MAITPDVSAADAALKTVAVEDFHSKINQRFSEYEVKAQQAIACNIEIDKLDDVTEFFTLDTGSSQPSRQQQSGRKWVYNQIRRQSTHDALDSKKHHTDSFTT